MPLPRTVDPAFASLSNAPLISQLEYSLPSDAFSRAMIVPVKVKAELLGKMTEVGLFTDRKEITVTHQTADELREKLREKLEVLKKNADGIYEVSSQEECPSP